MTLKKIILLTITATSALIFVSCSSMIYKAAYPTLMDGKYDSEFPYRGSSEQLQQIGNTIQRVNCIAFYKSYVYSYSSKLKLSDLNDSTLSFRSSEVGTFDKSSAGTATMIYSDDGKVCLLTCAHVVSFPDTIISYYVGDDGNYSEYVQSISFKQRQLNYIAGFPGGSGIDILVSDENIDIAILGGKYNALEMKQYPVFPYPFGEAKQLEWGSFVYAMGYPMNFKMITKAIVSSPDFDKKGSFLIDAVVNKGFSGGVVLGIRDGVPNFEFVGMIRAVPEDRAYVLRPEKLKNHLSYDPIVPYKGDIYVDLEQSLKYGITKVISIEVIREFFDKHKEEIIDKGYNIEEPFK